MFDYAWHYALPVAIFAYCYGHILCVIRRRRKVVTGHAARSQDADVTVATVAMDRNTGQAQQQTPAAAETGAKMSRRELNVLQTMIVVVVCFVICWTPGSFANIVQSITVCLLLLLLQKY